MHLLNEIFDHIYLINLRRRSDRLKIMEHKLNKKRIIYEIFHGIDGYESKYDSIYDKIMVKKELNPSSFWIKSRGAIGIIMTYQKLLIDAQSKNYKNILIIEDDINFHNSSINYQNQFITL